MASGAIFRYTYSCKEKRNYSIMHRKLVSGQLEAKPGISPICRTPLKPNKTKLFEFPIPDASIRGITEIHQLKLTAIS